MPGDAPSLKQEDIEELLRQAQMASGLVPDATLAAPGSLPAAPSSAVTAASVPPPASQTQASTAAAAPAGVATAERPTAANRSRVTSAPTTGDDVQFLLAQAEQAIASVDHPVESAVPGLAPFELKDLAGAPANGEKATLELLKDVDLDLRIELGRTHMYLEDVLKLKRGSVVTLDKLAGDPVDVFVNGRLVARGEVLVLNDNFCVRVTELLTGDDFD
jgi:flagellar motor switch protein FliN/FliY